MIIMTLYGIVTFLLIIAFIVLCLWAYSPRRQPSFDAYANIPFISNSDELGQGDKHE